ncbi:MAG: glycosyltransferase family 4 protein [Candidatus Pacebacteria bacterium]|nr:glycosyltransferase family 4 protein [Candidatus Paceibacterota bacterium]NUQ56926.1 glycosyltransferase family 4 protein [Candidatus Paceibacter sp.]
MKKVLFIITKSVWGGAQKYVHDIAVNLPKDKFQAAVAGGGSGPMADKIKAEGLPYFEIKNFQRNVNILKEFLAFFEIIKILFREKPDIVHVSSSKAGGVAGLAVVVYSALRRASSFFHQGHNGNDSKTNLPASSPSKPLAVFTVHGWAFLEDRPDWQIRLIKFASKITCLFYDKIICVSRNDYNEALKNKIAPGKKLFVIHNGVKPEDYNFEERTEKEFVVGTIGEAAKNKGHAYLTEAAKIVPGIKLNIISNIPNAARYLKNFDIFVLPSIKEGLPYVILEAGLAGLPVVASNIGGILEIIEDDKNGLLVPPADPEALARAIKKLVEDKTLRENLAKNLHEKITKEFSLEKMLSATVAAYKKQSSSAENPQSKA